MVTFKLSANFASIIGLHFSQDPQGIMLVGKKWKTLFFWRYCVVFNRNILNCHALSENVSSPIMIMFLCQKWVLIKWHVTHIVSHGFCRTRGDKFDNKTVSFWGTHQVRTQYVALFVLPSPGEGERPNWTYRTWKLRGSDDCGEWGRVWIYELILCILYASNSLPYLSSRMQRF